MKREKNNNLVNQNSIEIMEESTTSKNIQRAVNPCGCTHTHTHTHTFSLNEYKNDQLNLVDRNAKIFVAFQMDILEKIFKHTENANIVNNSNDSSNLNNLNNANNHKAGSHNLWALLSLAK